MASALWASALVGKVADLEVDYFQGSRHITVLRFTRQFFDGISRFFSVAKLMLNSQYGSMA